MQKYLPAGEESHDVLQDLYIQLRKRAVDPREVDNPPAYLMRMATNLAIDTLRRRNRNPLDFTDPADLADIPDAIGDSVTPEQISADRQRIAIVGRAIDGLPPRCRDAFLLCKRDHLSPAEAAETLGISRNMVENTCVMLLNIVERCWRDMKTEYPLCALPFVFYISSYSINCRIPPLP